MSARIEQILEVIWEVEARFRSSLSGRDVSEFRLEALDVVASRRKIDRTTVSDKFRRQLQPKIPGTDAFDSALQDWLTDGDVYLRNALLARAESVADESRIDRFFSPRPRTINIDWFRPKLLGCGVVVQGRGVKRLAS